MEARGPQGAGLGTVGQTGGSRLISLPEHVRT